MLAYQEKAIASINAFVNTGNIHTLMIIGGHRSGKTTLLKSAAELMGIPYQIVDPKIDQIRQMQVAANASAQSVMYIINHVDRMSTNAKNALLKITEEAPENAYFGMTVLDENSCPETLMGRAYKVHIKNYTAGEVNEYAKCVLGIADPKVSWYLSRMCDCPGMAKDVVESGRAIELIQYAQYVADNISTAARSNIYKILGKVKLKESGDGFDPYHFVCALRAAYWIKAGNDLSVAAYIPIMCMHECSKAQDRLIGGKFSTNAALTDMIENIYSLSRG